MKKITQCVLTLFVIGIAVSCSKQPAFDRLQSADYQVAESREMSYPAYAASTTSWEGTGYNPRGAAGIEREIPSAFEDMSNLTGTVEQKAAASGASPEFLQNEVSRKLVKRASLRIRVENLETAEDSINELMGKHSAYASQTETEENYREYVIRVPHERYDVFLAGIDGMGRILHRSESAEDVTLRYYDLEGRLATKQELLKTFQAYLGKAKTIEEILSVEVRIADLQNDIDRTGKELRGLANLIDYATISLDIYGPVAAEAYRGHTLPERIKELFSSFGGFLSTIAIVLLGLVVYGIPVLLLLVLLFWLLWGRIGWLKKLWRFVAGRQNSAADKNKKEAP